MSTLARCVLQQSRCISRRSLSNFIPQKECMLPANCFENKTVFITGGGTGLGRDMTRVFSKLGAQVAIMSRKLDVLQQTASEITNETGNLVIPIQGDVRDIKSVKEGIDELEKEVGLPNVIINNAAGNFISPFERLSPNAFKTIIDIVLNGTANVTLDVGKRLIKAQQAATFLSISALYATTGSAFVVPSACAKAGVEALVKSLSVEWAKYGMRFNAIAPGPFNTKGAMQRLDPSGVFGQEFAERNPTKRIGEVEELSNLVTYMCSDYSSWLNGEIVNFDGGEQRALSGEFNHLQKIKNEQWDALEQQIRTVKGST